MAHPQTSARGLKQADALILGPTGLYASAYSASTPILDSNSTGLTIPGGLRIGTTQYISSNTTGVTINGKLFTANSTGYIFSTVAAKPSARAAAKFAFLRNSTGVNALMVNTTGTTWKYLNVTSVLPT